VTTFPRVAEADIPAADEIFGPLSKPAPEALHELLHPGEPMPSHAGAISIHGALTQWRNTAIREADFPRLQTGIPRIDRAMRGLQPGELLGILARTASGKTILASNIVDSILMQRPASAALVVNLEMPCAQLIGRHLRMHFRQTEEQLEREIRADTLELDTFTRRHQNLYFLDRGAQTLPQIERAATDLRAQIAPMSLDCIVVDHCGLVRVGRATSAYERATETAIALKQLARQHTTVVIAVIQANRAGNQETDPVSLESARDSGAYEENCDFLLTMGKIQSMPAQPSTVKARLAKNRRGPNVPVTLAFDPVALRMRELVEEDRG
jgi:replicative DNA helicase